MPDGYKFLHSRDLSFWTDKKTIKINTLTEFAKAPAEGGYSDPNEVLINLESLTVADTESPEGKKVVNNLQRLGAPTAVKSKNVGFWSNSIKLANRYVFCLSTDWSEAIFRRWREIENYDAAIYLPDVERFARALTLADARSAAKLGSTFSFSSATYLPIPLDARTMEFDKGFIKDEATFGWQQEMRVWWTTPVPETEGAHVVHVPDLHHYFRVKSIPTTWRL